MKNIILFLTIIFTSKPAYTQADTSKFDMAIQACGSFQIGEKLKLGFNYNTGPAFDLFRQDKFKKYLEDLGIYLSFTDLKFEITDFRSIQRQIAMNRRNLYYILGDESFYFLPFDLFSQKLSIFRQ